MLIMCIEWRTSLFLVLPLCNLHEFNCKFGLCFLVCLGSSPKTRAIVGQINGTVTVFIVVSVLVLAVIAIVIPVVILKRRRSTRESGDKGLQMDTVGDSR